MPLWLNLIGWGLAAGLTVFAWSLCKAASDAEKWDDEDEG